MSEAEGPDTRAEPAADTSERSDCRWWVDLPLDRPVAVRGVDLSDLESTIESLPPTAPAVVVFRELRGHTLPTLTSEVLAHLDSVARMLYPAWLDGGERIEGRGAAARAAVQVLASRQSRRSGAYANFLAGLADRSLTSEPYTGRLADDVRVEALLDVIKLSYQRSGVALLVNATDVARERRAALIAAAQWISAHGHAGVWLIVDEDAPDHIRTINISGVISPPGATVVVPPVPEVRSPVVFAALSGRPHPNSPTEKFLEEKLAKLRWAANRHWNYTMQLSPLFNPIRVDLIWLDERCIVEIDGDEHRFARNYDSDRRRDARLLLRGYAVLRFTNWRIYHDLASTLHTIEKLLQARREP